MPTILWNRSTQKVVMTSGKAMAFRDSADADSNLNGGLTARLTEESIRAGLGVPVIDKIVVN